VPDRRRSDPPRFSVNRSLTPLPVIAVTGRIRPAVRSSRGNAPAPMVGSYVTLSDVC
jgi:hypothetical protein